MNSDSISQEAINAWRDYVLKQIVENLEANKDKIMDQLEHVNAHGLTRQDINQEGLLDFDIAITLHRDKRQSFGRGLGFLKATIIR